MKLSKFTYRQWVSAMCLPLILMLLCGAWTCSQSQQQRAIAYVDLAVNTTTALLPVIPALAPIVPYLQTAQAGVNAWQAGQPIPQNVVTALQAALAQAEKSFSGLTPAQETAIAILVAAIISALQIAGVVTAPRMSTTSQYVGKSPAELKKEFNANAKAAGVQQI